MNRRVLFVVCAVVILSTLGTSCAAPTPQVITQQVEKVVTQQVEKVVTQQVEKVVTQQVEKLVEVVVTPTPAGRAEIRKGGTIVEAAYEKIAFFDPWQVQLRYSNVYSYLINVTGDLQLHPGLASSWDVSPDAKVFTFHLNPKATWYDGKPVTADDVKFTFERAAIAAAKSRWLGQAKSVVGAQDYIDGKATEVSGIKVVDPQTVEFTLLAPNVAFLTSTFNQPIAPKHIWESIKVEDVTKSDYSSKTPIGSGPWKVTNYVPDQMVEMERHEGFFEEGKPYIDKYVIKFYQNQPATAAALEAGEVDVAMLAYQDVERIAVVPYLDILEIAKRGSQIISMNVHLDPWKNPEVRKAIAYAMDVDGICQAAFSGACDLKSVGHTFPQSWAWSPSAAKYPYDPAKAKQMLVDAKFDFNKEYVLQTYYSTPDVAAVHALLTDLGLKIKLQQLDAPTYVQERVKDEWDIAYIGTFGSADPNDVVQQLRCNDSTAINFLRYCNPEVDKLLAEGVSIADVDARQKHYQKIDELLAADVVYYPLFISNLPVGYNRRVANFSYNRWWYDYAEEWYLLN